MNTGKSRVEIFDVELNNYIISSWHKTEDIAIINADVISKSRQTKAQVITNGNIVYEVGKINYEKNNNEIGEVING
jgi:hypothetical protein